LPSNLADTTVEKLIQTPYRISTNITNLTITIKGGIGVTVSINNIGEFNATNVTTQIIITGGAFHYINIARIGPFVAPLSPKVTLKGKIFPLGLGSITIDVTVHADNAAPITKTVEGFIVLFFVILK
jgi:hypothetical protein